MRGSSGRGAPRRGAAGTAPLALTVLAAGACPQGGGAAPWWGTSVDVSHATLPTDGTLTAGDAPVPQTMLAVYPSDAATGSAKYPLIAFAHGAGVKPATYRTTLLNTVAGGGFIILAPDSCSSGGWCENFYQDQGHVIEHAYANRDNASAPAVLRAIDWTYKVGLLGHSMGGFATLRSAASGPVSYHNAGAAAALAPATDGVTDPATGVSVPVMYVIGEEDTRWKAAGKNYWKHTPTTVDRAIVDMTSWNHNGVWSNSNFDLYIKAFFLCEIGPKSARSAWCQGIFANASSITTPICANKVWPQTQCEWHLAE